MVTQILKITIIWSRPVSSGSDICLKDVIVVWQRVSVVHNNSWLTKRMFGEGNDTPLQYSCLENRMDGGAW